MLLRTQLRTSLQLECILSCSGRHRYFHKLYALDITLALKGATKSQIERAMRDHVLANAELIGTYQKGDR
jgi:phosphatidylethanolamine-binding protein (PEBP) family uncharacterized protein